MVGVRPGSVYRLLRRSLFLVPPEPAHRLGMAVLRRLPTPREVGPVAEGLDLSVTSAGLRFSHPVMLAAGFDKDAEAVGGFFALGFSAVEVGTVTPRPQPGNPAPRLFRLPQARALINRMGFNNHGMEAMAGRLERLTRRPGPVGVNIGKNKDTPLDRATEDYLAATTRLGPLADYLVVNASSPNTPGLRQLQEPGQLRALLGAVKGRLAQVAPGKPLFLKIAPDLAPEAVDAVVEVAVESGLLGLICTNTTVARPVQGPHAEEEGGLSGAPLGPLALATLRRAAVRSRRRLVLWASGGIFTSGDVLERLRAGAEVVQVYTALVYEGPAFVRSLLSDLARRLRAEGMRSLADLQREPAVAVGAGGSGGI